MLLKLVNGESDNFAAEMLLKELGATVAPRGSTAAGARVVQSGARGCRSAARRSADRRRLRPLALRPPDRERSSPRSCAPGAADPGIRDAFVTSLAVAGVSGTLEKRLDLPRRPAAVSIAKTGTTFRASALAGFVRRRYVFAILQNGRPVPYWTARAAQDRFVTRARAS